MEKLSPELMCIQSLSGILAAVMLETDDPVLKQFINMMTSAAAAEYQQEVPEDKLDAFIKLFTPEKLTKEFREAILIMRQNYLKRPEEKIVVTKH